MAVIPGRAKREPGTHNPCANELSLYQSGDYETSCLECCGVWIPGSRVPRAPE